MTQSPQHQLLTLRDVAKTFGTGTEALAPTAFSLKESEFVSLVGPSGCGKSTLLRIIAGLVPQTAGDLAVNNPKIGFVFQEPTLMPWATVIENVQLPFHLTSKPEGQAADHAKTVLELVGLADFANAYPRELSGGMRMRVSIARALIGEPTLLLLDEPFAALDEFNRAQLNEDLLRLWEEQKWSAIFVTHSIREAVFLANRVLVMSPRPGRIISDIEVPFDYPRKDALRNDHAYSDLCASISQQLASSMHESAL
jgi:NitT/TauT family transport system ATP-binding protein